MNPPIPIRAVTVKDLPLVKALYNQLTTDSENVEKDLPIILEDPNSLCFILGESHGMAMCYVRHCLAGKSWLLMKSLLTASIGAKGMEKPSWSTALRQQKK